MLGCATQGIDLLPDDFGFRYGFGECIQVRHGSAGHVGLHRLRFWMPSGPLATVVPKYAAVEAGAQVAH